ncbi:Gfo/Idh/MocA family protein [Propionibacteriaceae bacterium Y2011]
MIDIGIIGCGGLGKVHADALTQVPDARVVALCDPVPGAAERVRDASAPEAACSTDPEQLLADDRLAAIWIATPNDSHADLAIRALSAGKHVFVEKPLARTAEECAAIMAAADAADRLVMAGYKMRFFEMITKARELVPDPISVHVQVLDGRWPDDRWVNDPASGGGNVAAQGCHGTDLIRHLVGKDPREVYAVGGPFYSTRVTTNLSAVYRFDDDVSATLTVGDADTPPATSKFFAQLVGDGVSATCSSRLTELTFHRTGHEPEVFRGPEVPWHVEDAAFCAAITAGGPSPIDARDGWYATAMTEFAITSATEHRPVEITIPG